MEQRLATINISTITPVNWLILCSEAIRAISVVNLKVACDDLVAAHTIFVARSWALRRLEVQLAATTFSTTYPMNRPKRRGMDHSSDTYAIFEHVRR